VSGGALRDRCAIITGGARGIGLATAERFLAAGARVALVDRDGAEAAARVLGGDGVLGIEADVRDAVALDAMVAQVLDAWGGFDVLVASAGILRAPGRPPGLVCDMTPEDWDTVVGVDLTGVFLSNRAVLGALAAAGGGDIVNIASVAGRRPLPFDAAYSAAKAGVLGFTEALAAEVARQRIRVTAVLPDAVDTGLWEQNRPVPRPGAMLAPERVADLIAFLVELPGDCVLVEPMLLPFGGRPGHARRLREPVGAVEA
jgi:NAD(P)-dependent dehydrogenase (short-subunit alcohol dehydrogenase family)